MKYVYLTLAAFLAVGSHALDEPISQPILRPPSPSSIQTQKQRPPPSFLTQTQHPVPPTLDFFDQRPLPPTMESFNERPPSVLNQNQRPPPPPASMQNQRPPPPSSSIQHQRPPHPSYSNENQRPPPQSFPTQNQRPHPPKLEPEHPDSPFHTHNWPPVIDTDMKKPSEPNVVDFGNNGNQQPEYIRPSQKPEEVVNSIEPATPKYPKHPPKFMSTNKPLGEVMQNV